VATMQRVLACQECQAAVQLSTCRLSERVYAASHFFSLDGDTDALSIPFHRWRTSLQEIYITKHPSPKPIEYLQQSRSLRVARTRQCAQLLPVTSALKTVFRKPNTFGFFGVKPGFFRKKAQLDGFRGIIGFKLRERIQLDNVHNK